MVGNYIKRIISVGCFSFFMSNVLFCSSVVAQNPVVLDPIVVTAERFPVREKESARFVTVISMEELQETGANNLVDALNRIGGFAYKAYGPLGITHGGMNSKLSIRGLENGELVLINGIPIQGTAGHAYDLDVIPVDQIERVEILKGAASTLYGADAMTGVINIITKKPDIESAPKISAEIGGHGYQNYGASFQNGLLCVGGNYSHLSALTEISRSFSQKYRYNTDETHKYSFYLNLAPLDDLYIDYLGSYDDTGFKKVYDSESEDPVGTEQEHYKHFADVCYENELLRLKGFGNYSNIKRDEYTDPSEPDDNNKNYNYGLAGDYKFHLLSSELVVGGDYVYRGADYNNQYGKHHRNDYAIFLLAKKTMAERFTLTLGAREQLIKADSDGADHDIFLPTAGLTIKTTDTLNFFANTGKAFRAPTFNNLYYSSSFMGGNPKLDPEEGWTYELGIKFDHDLLRARLVGFFMEYKDKIEIDRSQGYPLTYFNAGDYKSSGLEWEFEIAPFIGQAEILENISLMTSGYWADPVAEDVEGKEYQAGPKLQLSFGLSYLSENMVWQFSGNFLGERERALDEYLAFDIYGKYKLFKGYLTVGVDNIFDEEVQVSGDLSSSASNQYVYYEISRLFKIGYEMRF